MDDPSGPAPREATSWPPPPPAPGATPASAPRSRAATVALAMLAAVGVLLGGFIVVGLTYHVDRRIEQPGSATPLSVTVKDARSYKPKGSFLLLTVFVHDHPTLFQYWRDKLFGDHIVDEKAPPPTPIDENHQNVCDMSDAQTTARFVALARLGLTPKPKPGVEIQQIADPGVPAASVLRCGDIIDAVDGTPTPTTDALHAAVSKHHPGDTVDIAYRRADATQHASVKLVCNPDADASRAAGRLVCAQPTTAIIGVIPGYEYDYPVDVRFDTGDVTGPSGGLAMTLSVLNRLTPCNLTGGQNVAVTGTIAPDGSVGGIGGTPLKVIAAHRAGAKLFIVGDQSDDLPQARALATGYGMRFVVVKTLADALSALRDNGGADPACTLSKPH